MTNFNRFSENGTSAACQTATTAFSNCFEDRANSAYINAGTQQKSCDGCKSEYQSLSSGCNDNDFKSNFFVWSVSLDCHQEDGKYCQTKYLNNFTCDNCAKYVSQKAKSYNYVNAVAEYAANETVIEQCATAAGKSDSSTLKSISILALVTMSFL